MNYQLHSVKRNTKMGKKKKQNHRTPQKIPHNKRTFSQIFIKNPTRKGKPQNESREKKKTLEMSMKDANFVQEKNSQSEFGR